MHRKILSFNISKDNEDVHFRNAVDNTIVANSVQTVAKQYKNYTIAVPRACSGKGMWLDKPLAMLNSRSTHKLFASSIY